MLMKFTVAEVLGTTMVPKDASPAQLRSLGHRVDFKYDPRPGFLYVRSRAISSRCNDNHDEFPAAEIKKAFKSFVGKPVFVNHNNDNHRRARGVVIDAALHEDKNPDGTPDTWAEVLMEVDAVRFPKLAEALIKGHIDRTSMGTDVAFSICSACGNKASSPSEYCEHIPRLKGKRLYKAGANGNKEGVLIREICYGLGFFENSLLVEEPADPTAYVWGLDTRGIDKKASKTASENPMYPNGKCDHCGFGLDDETHCTNEDCYEAPCNRSRCAELNAPFHTNGEHVDPDDQYSDDNMDVKRLLHDTFGENHDGEWLLNQQRQGPTKYSSKTATNPQHPQNEPTEPGYEQAPGDVCRWCNETLYGGKNVPWVDKNGETACVAHAGQNPDWPKDTYPEHEPVVHEASKKQANFDIPLGDDDMEFFRKMHEQGQRDAEMEDHARKRVVNLADPADLKSHMFEAHGWDESDLWRNSHPADHPRMEPGTNDDRPLTDLEIRGGHGEEHYGNPDWFPTAATMHGSHFHTASKVASYEDFHRTASWVGSDPEDPTKFWESPRGGGHSIHIKDQNNGPLPPHQYVVYYNNNNSHHFLERDRGRTPGTRPSIHHFFDDCGRVPDHVYDRLHEAFDAVDAHAENHRALHQEAWDRRNAVPARSTREHPNDWPANPGEREHSAFTDEDALHLHRLVHPNEYHEFTEDYDSEPGPDAMRSGPHHEETPDGQCEQTDDHGGQCSLPSHHLVRGHNFVGGNEGARQEQAEHDQRAPGWHRQEPACEICHAEDHTVDDHCENCGDVSPWCECGQHEGSKISSYESFHTGVSKAASHEEEPDETECAECGDPDHWTRDHRECDYCGRDHDTDDHEDEPEEDDSYVHHGYRGLEVSHGNNHIGTYPDVESATHALFHAQHESGYFPNAWMSGEHGPSARPLHEATDSEAHYRRWFPNLGGTGLPHEGAEPAPVHEPIDEHTSTADAISHLRNHHNQSTDDLHRYKYVIPSPPAVPGAPPIPGEVPGECYHCLSHEHETRDHDSREDDASPDAFRPNPPAHVARPRGEYVRVPMNHRFLLDHHENLHAEREEYCDFEGEDCPWRRSGHTHRPSGHQASKVAAVDMNREKPVKGMTFNPGSHYRMLGEAGWNDFQASGTIRAKPGNKQDYKGAYFGKGSAFERYRSRSTSHDYVAEVHDQTAMKPSGNGYPIAARPLGSQDVTVHRIDNATNKVDVVHSPDRPHPAFHIDPKTADHGDHEDPEYGPDEDGASRSTWHGHDEDGTYEGGLGCPHCHDAFFREDARTKHIRTQHPGEYSGPTQDMADLREIMGDDWPKTSSYEDFHKMASGRGSSQDRPPRYQKGDIVWHGANNWAGVVTAVHPARPSNHPDSPPWTTSHKYSVTWGRAGWEDDDPTWADRELNHQDHETNVRPLIRPERVSEFSLSHHPWMANDSQEARIKVDSDALVERYRKEDEEDANSEAERRRKDIHIVESSYEDFHRLASEPFRYRGPTADGHRFRPSGIRGGRFFTDEEADPLYSNCVQCGEGVHRHQEWPEIRAERETARRSRPPECDCDGCNDRDGSGDVDEDWEHADGARWSPDHTASKTAMVPPTTYENPEDHPFFQEHPVHVHHLLASWGEATDTEKANGKVWYPHGQILSTALAHGDTAKGAGVISSFSPQKYWPSNMLQAGISLHRGHALGSGEGHILIEHHQQDHANRIMNGEHWSDVLHGHKTRDFAHLLEHGGVHPDHDPIACIDRHAVSAACGHRVSSAQFNGSPIGRPRRAYYQHVADVYHEASGILGVPSHVVQATTWLVQLRKNIEAETARGSNHDKGRASLRANELGRWKDFAAEHHPGLLAPAYHTASKTASGDDRWVTCNKGHEHWGASGAAGLLLRHTDEEGTKRFYLQKRSPWVQHGGTYSIPGGALHRGESPEDGAHREAAEEMGDLPATRHARTHTDDHGGWKYHTVIADVDHQFTPDGDEGHEHAGGGWYTDEEKKHLYLHPGFAASWHKLKAESKSMRSGDSPC